MPSERGPNRPPTPAATGLDERLKSTLANNLQRPRRCGRPSEPVQPAGTEKFAPLDYFGQSPIVSAADGLRQGIAATSGALALPPLSSANGIAMSRRLTYFLFSALVAAVASATTHAQSAVNWRVNLDAAKLEAAQSNRLLLIHFYTKSCGPCKLLEKQVFNQPHVAAALEQNYVPVKVDADASPALRGAFRIERVPTDVVLTHQGNLLAKFGCPSTPDGYLKQLTNLANHFRQTTSTKTTDAPAQINSAYAGLNVKPPTAGTPPLGAPPAAATPGKPATPALAGAPAVARQAAPQVTANPYVGGPQAGSGPQLPANAMPQSYRNRYAQTPTAVAPTPPAAIAATTVPPQSTAPAPPVAAGPTNQVAATTPTTPTTQVNPTQDAAVTPTASEAAVAAQSGPPKLPAGAAPLGFDGCCPVTLSTANKWVRGRVDVGIEHRGRLYLFAGAKERDQFLANPDAFSPVFSGLDPVLMLDENVAKPGSRQFGYKYRGAVYLFSSEETKRKFAENRDAYAVGVRQAMNRIDGASGGVIRR